MNKVALVIILYFSCISSSYSHSMSQELGLYVFTEKYEKVKISIGNINRHKQVYKLSVKKLKFSESKTRLIINDLSKIKKNSDRMTYLEKTEPDDINENILAKKITLSGGRYTDYKVPVFDLEENRHNFYEICMLSVVKKGFSVSICTRAIIYYSPR
ncbi:hypothetical protein [Vibrio parahaemolyticus]|uniref:hypothetical protein n=1 Tax=Vibrio parahaemolyticus TaxID=670 RepID=UPI001112CF4A|nr:hypothetical protein [Vibrio parahaemolyticus]